MSRIGIVVLYRWRIHPGAEDGFVQAWSHVTTLLRTRGSLGSRLHRGSDGLWYGYAQWPDVQTRQTAFAQGPVDEAATLQMQNAIAESMPEVILTIAADYLIA